MLRLSFTAFTNQRIHYYTSISIMGGSISSLHKLRSQFLISLYKKGLVNKTSTIKSLFESKGTIKDDVRVIPKPELTEIFGQDSSSILKDIFDKCRFQNDCIPINFIVDFLEQGLFNSSTRERIKKQLNDESVYPEVWRVLSVEDAKEITTDLTLFKTERTKGKDEKDNEKKPMKVNDMQQCRSIWKKHETVIQERIVKHVTVDKDGQINELITTDKSQNDIIHIESKISGEYAHREYTQQEQTEVMDNEMSTFIRATEEYIHLKSKEDEYEYLHSEVPNQTESDDVEDTEYESPHHQSYEDDHELLHEEEEVDYS